MPKGPPFTAANAAEFARRSHVVRKEAKERLRLLEQAAIAAAVLPQSTAPLCDTAEPSDAFIMSRLIRVRAQLNMIDSLIETERDPNKLDRLAAAQSRLAEQERKLAGRPLPGSNRPRSTRKGPSIPPPAIPE